MSSLQETLASLKSGLEECIALLAPKEPGSTLVVSSPRSESVKGFVTRVGTRIVKGVGIGSLPFISSSQSFTGLVLCNMNMLFLLKLLGGSTSDG